VTDAAVFVTAPAKINLSLHVGHRRADGYHDLESLVAFVAHADEIRLERDEAFTLSITGPFAGHIAPADDNLVLMAAKLLAKETNARTGARIGLEKKIPVASGLGGGSADAAAVLRGLVRLWNLDIDADVLRKLGASLGADVPVCIDSAPAWMEGKGERVRVLPPLPVMPLVLVNPRVAVSTAEVFAGLRERSGLGATPPEPFEDVFALVRYLRTTKNDLEESARAIAPVTGEVLSELQRLPDVLIARMSGSGATCFALFADDAAALAARLALQSAHPEWWCVETALAQVPF
jgi:4-diphosphocytidyl-2-C-methyl-D-erythritol kinase